MTEDPINQPPSEPVDISVPAPADVVARGNGTPVDVQAAGVVTTTVATVETQVTQQEMVFPLPSVIDIQIQIGNLRERITKLVPAEDALEKLVDIRSFAEVKRRASRFWFLRLFRGNRYYESFEFPKKPFPDRLDEIDGLLQAAREQSDLRSIHRQLTTLGTDVGIKIRQIESTYLGLVNSLTTSKELVEDLMQKIGPRELRDEARMHLGIVAELVGKLESQEHIKRLDVLSDKFQGAIGIMIELEQRRSAVEDLVYKDLARRQWTVAFVIAYIALVLALAVFVGVRWGSRFFIGDGPLSALRLPLIGIPWPVIVWSLIGSFAAMIYRFNKKPIYDFGDAVKWMLTRPVQGVVLGAAFYLVLISGLFLFGGGATPENNASHTNDVILILSFLVGFSDRFADSVFNAIVKKYSGGNSTHQPPGRNKKGRNDPGTDHATT